MRHLPISMSTISPLSVRSDHASGGTASAKYISGTTLLGSLAAAHRLLYPDRIDEFERLFLRGNVLYPNLYPAAFQSQAMQGTNLPVYPLPKTAQSCKRHSGFLDDDEHDGHGVRDGLMDWTLFKLCQNTQPEQDSQQSSQANRRSLEALCPSKYCHYDGCGEAMNHFDGYYRRAHDTMTSAQGNAYMHLRTHTGINRETGTVQEDILYNRQVFEEGMPFWGMIKLADDEPLVSQFTTFLKQIESEQLVRVGTGRTRGMGKVALNVGQLTEEQGRFDTFSKRLAAFNRLCQQKIGAFGLNTYQNDYYFAVTLHAPVILCDDLLRYQGTIDTATLTCLMNDLPMPGLRSVYQAAGVQRITGWQELWGMPRTNEYAIETGSVFLFACSQHPDEAVLHALFALEEQGIGKRRREGFGRICISDQFHQEVKPR